MCQNRIACGMANSEDHGQTAAAKQQSDHDIYCLPQAFLSKYLV